MFPLPYVITHCFMKYFRIAHNGPTCFPAYTIFSRYFLLIHTALDDIFSNTPAYKIFSQYFDTLLILTALE